MGARAWLATYQDALISKKLGRPRLKSLRWLRQAHHLLEATELKRSRSNHSFQ
jgi:hypothetical protein